MIINKNKSKKTVYFIVYIVFRDTFFYRQIYMDKMNQSSKIAYWGPRLWYLIHKITYNYPLNADFETQQLYMNYFYITKFIIPCPACALHFKTSMTLKSLQNNLSNRQQVIEWFRVQHNDVNTLNNKRIYTGFEVDFLYQNNEFKHDYFWELVTYLKHLVFRNGIERKAFVHWVLLTYYIHPCEKCRELCRVYIKNNDIEKKNYFDNKILDDWLNGIFQNTTHT